MSFDRERNGAEDAELLSLMKASAYAPPADLKVQVMRRIRAEKAKAAHRRLMKRITAAVCAAVILVPALVIVVPMLRGSGNSVAEADGMMYSAAEAEDFVLSAGGTMSLDGKTNADAVYDASPSGADDEVAAENATSATAMFTPPPKDSVCDGTEDAVDLPTEAVPENAGTGASTPPTEAETAEPAFYETLREIVGADAFDEWLAQYDGAPDCAEQAAYEYFGLTP